MSAVYRRQELIGRSVSFFESSFVLCSGPVIKTTSTYIDSHCHLADPRWKTSWLQHVQAAEKHGITQFLLAGVDPQDWQRQRNITSQHSGIFPVFGLHPYFVSANPSGACEQALDLLSRQLPQAYALGETGLDFRTKILQSQGDLDEDAAKAHQIDFFEKQLELAKIADKPVVLHVVRAFDEALKIVQTWGAPKKGGLIHAFNGSSAQAQKWIREGFHISVGCALLHSDNDRLKQAVLHIPLENLCLETDSPDQPPPGVLENEPSNLLLVAEAVAQIKRVSREEILNQCSHNTRSLIGL